MFPVSDHPRLVSTVLEVKSQGHDEVAGRGVYLLSVFPISTRGGLSSKGMMQVILVNLGVSRR